MKKEEKFYYKIRQTKPFAIKILVLICILELFCIGLMLYAPVHNIIKTAIFAILALILIYSIFYVKNKKEYDAISISEDYQTLTLFKNNLPVKVIYNDCISNVDLNVTTMTIKCKNGDVTQIKMDVDDVIDLYVQIFKKVSDFDPSRQPQPQNSPSFPSFINKKWLKIFGISLFFTIALFSFHTVKCDRVSGVCTMKSYTVISGINKDTTEIKNIKNIYSERMRLGHRVRYFTVYIQCSDKLIDTYTMYLLPFTANNYVNKFQAFLNGNEKTFAYNYISPIFIFSLFGLFMAFGLAFRIITNKKSIFITLLATGLIVSGIFQIIDKNNAFHYKTAQLPQQSNEISAKIPVSAAQNKNSDDELTEIKVNAPTEYDYLSREEIFNLRKKYVNDSIFASKFYSPSNEVFGAIEGGKPWYGENVACPFSAKDITKGYSARSVYLNNPAVLVGPIQTLGYKYPQDTPFCQNKLLNFIPQKILYSKNANLIIVNYNANNSLIHNIQEPQYGMPFGFVGLNARDLGYKYGYAVSYKNIIFKENNNISNHLYTFRDFLHTGGSCKVPGGCTNTSPLQPEMDFVITQLPAHITFKLWKNKPASLQENAEIMFKVKFE